MSEHKEKIVWDGESPSTEQIQSKADFENLKQRFEGHQGAKRFNKAVVMGVAAGILAISAIVWYAWDSTPEAPVYLTQEDQAEQVELKLKVPEEVFEIAGNEAVDIFTENGTIISVPADAFVDQDGNAVVDDLEFVYTEYDNPLAIFASGISMTYDSAGTSYPFQTAGMFEIQAKNGSGHLTLNPGKQLQIYHPTTLLEEDMNTYSMADRNEDWVYEGRSEMLTYEDACERQMIRFDTSGDEDWAEVKKDMDKLLEKEEELVQSEPQLPRQVNPNNYSFDLDVDPVEFPELSAFENVRFEVVDDRFRNDMFNQVWNDVRLSKNNDGSYLVRLTNADQTAELRVFPVLSVEEREAAMNKYERDLASHLDKVKDLAQEVFTLEEHMLEVGKARKQDLRSQRGRRVINKVRATIDRELIVRNFNVRGLGIFNCDKPYKPGPGADNVPANFEYENGEQVEHLTFINLDKNVFDEMASAEYRNLKYKKSHDHIAITQNHNGEVALVCPAEFKAVEKGEVYVVFTMKDIHADYSNYQAVEEEFFRMLEEIKLK